MIIRVTLSCLLTIGATTPCFSFGPTLGGMSGGDLPPSDNPHKGPFTTPNVIFIPFEDDFV